MNTSSGNGYPYRCAASGVLEASPIQSLRMRPGWFCHLPPTCCQSSACPLSPLHCTGDQRIPSIKRQAIQHSEGTVHKNIGAKTSDIDRRDLQRQKLRAKTSATELGAPHRNAQLRLQLHIPETQRTCFGRIRTDSENRLA
jgi:hypothetical protein